jgi:hypothetical protein
MQRLLARAQLPLAAFLALTGCAPATGPAPALKPAAPTATVDIPASAPAAAPERVAINMPYGGRGVACLAYRPSSTAT